LGVLIQGDMAHHVLLVFGGTAFVFGLHVGQVQEQLEIYTPCFSSL
jgi:hypothetical protein